MFSRHPRMLGPPTHILNQLPHVFASLGVPLQNRAAANVSRSIGPVSRVRRAIPLRLPLPLSRLCLSADGSRFSLPHSLHCLPPSPPPSPSVFLPSIISTFPKNVDSRKLQLAFFFSLILFFPIYFPVSLFFLSFFAKLSNFQIVALCYNCSNTIRISVLTDESVWFCLDLQRRISLSILVPIYTRGVCIASPLPEPSEGNAYDFYL